MHKQRTGCLPLFFLFLHFPFIAFFPISVLKPLGYNIGKLTAISKMDNQRDLLYITGNSAQCYVAAYITLRGREGGKEFGGKWLHGYVAG